MKELSIMTPLMRAELRAEVDKRRAVVCSQIEAVAHGFTTAMFIWGPGGLGKTHILTEQLTMLRLKSWQHHTAYSTPRGLFLSLAEQPDQVHLFEDCEQLYKTDIASSILRAACGSPNDAERWITYETANEKSRVKFRGGIIIASNENLSKSKGPLQAVASRFRPIRWDMSQQERIGCIFDIAEQGWKRQGRVLEPAQCREVARFLAEEVFASKGAVSIDIRTFVEHALPAYSQSLTSTNKIDWKDVVKSKLGGAIDVQETAQEKNERLHNAAVAIKANDALKGPEKIEEWIRQTGLGQAIYYRHLKGLKGRQK